MGGRRIAAQVKACPLVTVRLKSLTRDIVSSGPGPLNADSALILERLPTLVLLSFGKIEAGLHFVCAVTAA